MGWQHEEEHDGSLSNNMPLIKLPRMSLSAVKTLLVGSDNTVLSVPTRSVTPHQHSCYSLIIVALSFIVLAKCQCMIKQVGRLITKHVICAKTTRVDFCGIKIACS